MRNSSYKNSILEMLSKKHLLSVAEIQKEVGGDFSTVFRNLESLVKEGAIKKVVISKDSVMYEKVGKSEHDHFVCEGCGKVDSVDIKHDRLKVSGVIKDILIRGLCGKCS